MKNKREIEKVKLKERPYRIKVRQLVNDLFQDIDNNSTIPEKTANAICEVHTNKICAFLTQYDHDLREQLCEEVEKEKDPSPTFELSKLRNELIDEILAIIRGKRG